MKKEGQFIVVTNINSVFLACDLKKIFKKKFPQMLYIKGKMFNNVSRTSVTFHCQWTGCLAPLPLHIFQCLTSLDSSDSVAATWSVSFPLWYWHHIVLWKRCNMSSHYETPSIQCLKNSRTFITRFTFNEIMMTLPLNLTITEQLFEQWLNVFNCIMWSNYK